MVQVLVEVRRKEGIVNLVVFRADGKAEAVVDEPRDELIDVFLVGAPFHGVLAGIGVEFSYVLFQGFVLAEEDGLGGYFDDVGEQVLSRVEHFLSDGERVVALVFLHFFLFFYTGLYRPVCGYDS